MKHAQLEHTTISIKTPLTKRRARALVFGWKLKGIGELSRFGFYGDFNVEAMLTEIDIIEAVDAFVQPQEWAELVAVRDFLISRRSLRARIAYRFTA